MNTTIPIVFATDDNYAMYCYTAILSLINNAGRDRKYDIYVFETDLSPKNINRLASLSHDNIRVKCIDIKQYLENVHLESSIHLSIETYYRLFIPLILPEYKKVLYIDTDMIIMKDVGELFELDTAGKPVAVVADVQTEYMRAHAKELGVSGSRDQFNAGLLLMDTKRFEQEEIRDKCLRLLNEDYNRERRIMVFADQDALNVVLENNVTWIDPRWNYQVQYLKNPEVIAESRRTHYINGANDAFIYHYSGSIKPWNNPLTPKAEYFWDVVKNSEYLTDMIDKELRDCKNKTKSTDCFERYRLPYDKILPGSRIVIYAAGKIGGIFYEQITLTGYAKVVLWVDRAWESKGMDMVKPTEFIKQTDFDHVLIAVRHEAIAKEAIQELISLGVEREKIVWQDYKI